MSNPKNPRLALARQLRALYEAALPDDTLDDDLFNDAVKSEEFEVSSDDLRTACRVLALLEDIVSEGDLP